MERTLREDESEKVVSLFGRREKVKESTPSNQDAELEGGSLFLEAMRRNAQNRERLRAERNKANKSVLRSYRIKQ